MDIYRIYVSLSKKVPQKKCCYQKINDTRNEVIPYSEK